MSALAKSLSYLTFVVQYSSESEIDCEISYKNSTWVRILGENLLFNFWKSGAGFSGPRAWASAGEQERAGMRRSVLL